MPDAPYPSAGRGHIRHDAQVDYEPRNPVPDPGASVRYAALLYEITGWEIFSYAALAASESPEEADERRRIHRRRQPPWAGED